MHLFLSAGEPSGDLHGANLVRAIRAREPGVRISGFGGDRMADAGAELLYPLTQFALMGLWRVLVHLPKFFRFARQAETFFRTERPDAVVLIDYPEFNFALAKRARAAGIPVYYFVPPQIWAWRTGRVKKVRRWCDAVLTAMPFEDEWYHQRGVNTEYVGHPYFDELAAQKLDPAFLAAQQAKGGPVVSLLPGSRNMEVTVNGPLLLAAAKKIHAARPETRFLVASFKESQAAVIRQMVAGSGLPLEVHVGRTPELIELADACVSVSGSVGLEMLYRLKPAVVVYRIKPLYQFIKKWVVKVPYISLVNLLAEDELYPEFATARDDSEAIAGHVLRWLSDPASRAVTVGRLRLLRDRVAVPGACERAAEFLTTTVRPGRPGRGVSPSPSPTRHLSRPPTAKM
jgi:lipid-A-disaccharide synthase